MGVGDCLGGMCSCVGGCCRAACKIGTPKQRLMTAWFVLLVRAPAVGCTQSPKATSGAAPLFLTAARVAVRGGGLRHLRQHDDHQSEHVH